MTLLKSRSEVLGVCSQLLGAHRWRSRRREGLGLKFWLCLLPPEYPRASPCSQEGRKARGASPEHLPRASFSSKNSLSPNSVPSALLPFPDSTFNKWQRSGWGSRVYPVPARQTMNLPSPRWHRLSSKLINRAGAIETGPNTARAWQFQRLQ